MLLARGRKHIKLESLSIEILRTVASPLLLEGHFDLVELGEEVFFAV